MTELNLIREELSEIKYKITTFPDGEPHIVLGEFNRKYPVLILCRICNPNDLFLLMQVGDILNRQGVIFHIYIYYLMSARMDRVMSFGEAFSLKVVSDCLNSLKAETVSILEPHSDRVESTINNYCGNIEVDFRNITDNHLIVLPDAGAASRNRGAEKCVCCTKKRDPQTGKLSGFAISNTELLNTTDAPLLVVDDLCDGGGTFAGLAPLLREASHNRKMDILVTHMVNPLGIERLSNNYDQVYFTNSYKDWGYEVMPENVNVINVI